MVKLGIIGEKLPHTFSPTLYGHIFEKTNFEATYSVLEIPRDAFDFIVKDVTSDLDGYNVTIPYKSKIVGYLESASQDAKEIGAVNVVDAKKIGYNTDWLGFKKSLEKRTLKGKFALVLGAGGAARAIVYALKKMGLEVYVVNRTREKGENLAKDMGANYGYPNFSKIAIVVNATPLGMYPYLESRPSFDLSRLKRSCLVYDLVYNPQQTRFLKEADGYGLRTVSGLEMLVWQARHNLEFWGLFEAENFLESHFEEVVDFLKDLR